MKNSVPNRSAEKKSVPSFSIPSPILLTAGPLVLLSAVDLAVIGGAVNLLDVDFPLDNRVWAATLLSYCLFSVAAFFSCHLMFAPANKTINMLRRGEPPSSVRLKQTLDVLEHYPGRLLFMRVLTLVGVACVAFLRIRGLEDVSLTEKLAACSVILSAGIGVSLLWRVLLDYTLKQIRLRIAEYQSIRDDSALKTEWLHEGPLKTLRNLYRSGLICSGAGIAVLALFTVKFLSPQRRAILLLFTYAPLTLILLSSTWISAVKYLSRPLINKGFTCDKQDRNSTPQAAAQNVTKTFKAAQTLPYIFALIQFALWIIGGILLTGQAVRLFGMDVENAAAMFASAFITSLAVLLYQVLWHRRLLRPFLQQMGKNRRLELEHVRSPLSVRVKMLSGFGILTFFACATAVFWSFIQYRNLATDFIEKQAKIKLEMLNEKLATMERLEHGVRERDVIGVLRESAEVAEGVYYFLTRTGKVFTFANIEEPPPLPLEARTKMRKKKSGFINLSRENLSGAFTRIKSGVTELGSVAILYPSYRGRDQGLARQIKVLIVFFGLLLGVAAGIVILIVEDLTRPLKGLERRVEEMARGDFQRPIPAGLEVDEVGMLAKAFEGMRRSLDEKLSTIGALNLGLEIKVKERTSDLAKANEELIETLETLTKTQEQLIRSEKLASIGQLVAGIAHEINNPVNAVTNCLEPLENAMEGFLQSLDRDAPDFAQAVELSNDIRRIIRIIRNGTNRTRRIVSALGSYSRIDTEEMTLVDIHSALKDALEITAHLLVNIEVETILTEPGPVKGRPGQIEQVLVNLIANAAQALQEKPDGKITVTTRSQPAAKECEGSDELVITVSDNGPGIPDELLPKIFDPFFTTKDVGTGTGLGLSISHDIVIRHGGRIEVDGKLGAVFQVFLPKMPDKESECTSTEDSPSDSL